MSEMFEYYAKLGPLDEELLDLVELGIVLTRVRHNGYLRIKTVEPLPETFTHFLPVPINPETGEYDLVPIAWEIDGEGNPILEKPTEFLIDIQ